MTKLPTHHQLWSRASNSTRASILVRSRSAASRSHTRHHHLNGRVEHTSRGFGTDTNATSAAAAAAAATTANAATNTPARRDRDAGWHSVRGIEDEAIAVIEPVTLSQVESGGGIMTTTTTTTTTATIPTTSALLLHSSSIPSEATPSSSSSSRLIVYGPLTAEDTLLASNRSSHPPSAVAESSSQATSYYAPRAMPGSLAIRSHPSHRRRGTLWSPSTTVGATPASSTSPGAANTHMLVASPSGWTHSSSSVPFSTAASLRAAASLLSSPYWPGHLGGRSTTTNDSGTGGSPGFPHLTEATVTELDANGVEVEDQAPTFISAPAQSTSSSSSSAASLSLAQADSLSPPSSPWDEVVRTWGMPNRDRIGGDVETSNHTSSTTRVDADVLASLAASIDTLLHMTASQHHKGDSIPDGPRSYESHFFSTYSPSVEREEKRYEQGGAGGPRASHGSSSGSSSTRPPSPSYQASSGRGSPPIGPSPASSSILSNTNSSNQILTSAPSSNHAPPMSLSMLRPTPTTISKPALSVDRLAHAGTTASLSYSHQAIESQPSAIPLFEFQHGAYGIPKRHPLAAAPAPTRRGSRSSPPSRTGTRGMLAAAADFLTGPQTPPPPPPQTSASGSTSSTSSRKPWKKLDPSTMRSVQVGEDSYFLRPDAIGIADGVGGWATRPGANPAMFSRLLMHFCSVELSRFDWAMNPKEEKDGSDKKRRKTKEGSSSKMMSAGTTGKEEHSRETALQRHENLDPVEVMHRAWERCVRVARREGILGSTTALLALLRKDELRIANLGDCVLLIVRKGELFFRSQEQQHSFNFPVQLGMMVRRGTRDVEDLVEGLSNAGKTGTSASDVGWTTTSPRSSSSRASSEEEGQDEDYDLPEAESLVMEYTRRLDVISQRAAGAGLNQQAEESCSQSKEREALKRRALFEGKSEDEFEAEMKAAEEFDFDVNNPGASKGSSSSSSSSSAAKDSGATRGDQEGEEGGEEGEEEDRSTVYVGFDDAHPWDEPRRDCGRWTIKVQKGDIIIVASDGLVDNLFDDEIIEEVQRFAPPPTPRQEEEEEWTSDDVEEGFQEQGGAPGDASKRRDTFTRTDSAISLEDHNPTGKHPKTTSNPTVNVPIYPPKDFNPQLLSEALASRAKSISQDSKAIISPFQQRATEEGLHYVGGKHDDISVLVAVVGDASQRRGSGAGAGGGSQVLRRGEVGNAHGQGGEGGEGGEGDAGMRLELRGG